MNNAVWCRALSRLEQDLVGLNLNWTGMQFWYQNTVMKLWLKDYWFADTNVAISNAATAIYTWSIGIGAKFGKRFGRPLVICTAVPCFSSTFLAGASSLNVYLKTFIRKKGFPLTVCTLFIVTLLNVLVPKLETWEIVPATISMRFLASRLLIVYSSGPIRH